MDFHYFDLLIVFLSAIDAPGGFLFEWWSVFWDIFIARTNEKHSEVAASYIEVSLWQNLCLMNFIIQLDLKLSYSDMISFVVLSWIYVKTIETSCQENISCCFHSFVTTYMRAVRKLYRYQRQEAYYLWRRVMPKLAFFLACIQFVWLECFWFHSCQYFVEPSVAAEAEGLLLFHLTISLDKIIT